MVLDITSKDVVGYEGLYYVTEEGFVYSYTRTIYNPSQDSYYTKEGQKMALEHVRGGYVRVILCKDGKATKILVHRIVAKAFHPNPENKKHVNHKDGNKLNNHKDNVEWATASENTQHAYDTGLAKVDKIYDEETEEKIRAEYVYRSKSHGIIALGKKYGLSKSTIFNIVKER